jgi:glucose 1-dehydrogenase
MGLDMSPSWLAASSKLREGAKVREPTPAPRVALHTTKEEGAMGQLDGRIAIVTGSDSGIGQGIAEELAREGADVAITYLHDEAGAAETRRKVEACGRRAFVTRLDQADEASVSALFDGVAQALGTPDILVNNAGATDIKQSPVRADAHGGLRPDDQGRSLRPVLLQPRVRAAPRDRRQDHQHHLGARGDAQPEIHRLQRRQGRAADLHARPGAGAGAQRNTTVNAIAPGLTRAPPTLERIESPEGQEKIQKNIPLRRAGEPREVGRLAVYLASSDADYVTGQSFTIDGGLETNWGQGA